jgi:hypothetical protein
MNEHEALRIGILLDGKLIEERVIRERRRVTIGQSARATFAVPGSRTLPRSLVLFEPDGANKTEWRVRVPEGCQARISDGVAPRILASGEFPVGARARGKLTIGDVTVLFQRVAVANAPRPRLPASVRAPLFARVDWALAAVLVVSMGAHFGCVGYLRSLDFPRDTASVPPVVVWKPPVHFNIDSPKPTEAPKPTVASSDGSGKTPHHGGSPAPAHPKPQLSHDQLVDEVSKMGLIDVIGSKSTDGKGALSDVLGRGKVYADADQVFDNVGGVDPTASAGHGAMRVRGDDKASIFRRGGDLKGVHGPALVKTGERSKEKDVEIKGSPPVDPTGEVEVDLELLGREIKSRLGGLRSCYESGMRHSEGLAGKLVVRFSVSAVGKVVDAQAEVDTLGDPLVTRCMLERARSWRLPPLGGRYGFSAPFIFTQHN